MDRIPEPHQLAYAYYEQLEEQYERMVAYATCGDCANFNECPKDWASTPCGWCSEQHEHVLEAAPVKDNCETYEPLRG